jgi:hypothetical protein
MMPAETGTIPEPVDGGITQPPVIDPDGRVLHIAGFLHFRRTHGGVKRSRQIEAAISEAGGTTITLPNGHTVVVKAALRSPGLLLRTVLIALPLLWNGFTVKGVGIAIIYGVWLRQQIDAHRPDSVYLEVIPNIGMVLGTLLAAYGCRYVALPHNIEFLVPDQQQSYLRSPAAAFAVETEIFRRAQRVIAISDFDTAVIGCLGVMQAETLPYEPVDDYRDVLLRIAALREKATQSGYLILGTTGNPPTDLGLKRLLAEIAAQDDGPNFILAGFGTETLAPLAPSRVTVRGSVSDAELETLMVQCEALIIYQPPTSGFLTRITEAVLAGLPVYVLGGYRQAEGMTAQGVRSISSLAALP